MSDLEKAAPVQEAVALKWLPAPRKTEWGSGMVSADVEIDRDHTLTLYCEKDQTAKVDAMFRRVFCKEEQPEPVQEYASIPGTNVRVRLPSRPHDAGSHDQRMTPAVQRVVDAADRRARDKAAMPADCTTPTDCRAHGCHGACLPSPPQPQAEPVSMDKIKNTHTTITRFDFEQRPDHEYAGLPHRLYTQSSTDGCYLCACLAEIDRLKQQAEPVADKAQCDGGSCGVGGYCKQCPKRQAEPVAEPVAEPSVEAWLQAGRFCDANCTALDHHADCVIGNPSF